MFLFMFFYSLFDGPLHKAGQVDAIMWLFLLFVDIQVELVILLQLLFENWNEDAHKDVCGFPPSITLGGHDDPKRMVLE